MPADPQVQNALSREVKAVADLWDAIFALKQCRATAELLGIPAMTAEQLAESATGDLSHLTAAKVVRLFAGMDVLDVALLTPVSLGGAVMPPAKAIADVIR